LVLAVPANRYHTSGRAYPEQLPAFEYAERFETRRVNRVGRFEFQRATALLTLPLAAFRFPLSAFRFPLSAFPRVTR
jgi:hypothetical protein